MRYLRIPLPDRFVARAAGVFFLIWISPAVVPAQEPAAGDPVVIRAGDVTVTRGRFEEQFQLAMLMVAAESGSPIKNRAQIELLRRRYLDRRARELALLAAAKDQGISIPAGEVEKSMAEYLEMLGIHDKPEESLLRAGFSGVGQLREKLEERLIISAFLSKLNQEKKAEDLDVPIDDYIDAYLDGEVTTYPGRLNGSNSIE